MIRKAPLIVFAIVVTGYSFLNGQTETSESLPAEVQVLDGVYEFVSETTILVEPKPIVERRLASEWSGLWFFQSSRFSQTLMKKRRSYSLFPRTHQELKYESSAGSFILEGNTAILTRTLSLHPFGVGRSTTFEYRIEEGTLTLTETMSPYKEDLSKGQRVTVLRRIR
jgi:hypothetical protein